MPEAKNNKARTGKFRKKLNIGPFGQVRVTYTILPPDRCSDGIGRVIGQIDKLYPTPRYLPFCLDPCIPDWQPKAIAKCMPGDTWSAAKGIQVVNAKLTIRLVDKLRRINLRLLCLEDKLMDATGY
jgi:hypothetical protein